nr:hypothetical protein [Tanacetum cinerariifolium]
CLDCGSDSEAEDGLDNSMVVDEGEQDFTNPTNRQNFRKENGRGHKIWEAPEDLELNLDMS